MSSALPERLPHATLPAGATIARIHRLAGAEPFFGPRRGDPPSQRFHDPQGEFGVCFFGENDSASFVETFLRNPPVRLITRTELAGRRLSTFRIVRDVRLAKLYDEGLALIGCTADITSSAPPYEEPQALSREVWAHRYRLDGIRYRCRHDNGLYAIALFDRAAGALEWVSTEDLLGDRARLLTWAERYGFAIA